MEMLNKIYIELKIAEMLKKNVNDMKNLKRSKQLFKESEHF